MIKFIFSMIVFFLIFKLNHMLAVKLEITSFWFKNILPSFIVAIFAFFIFKKNKD